MCSNKRRLTHGPGCGKRTAIRIWTVSKSALVIKFDLSLKRHDNIFGQTNDVEVGC